MRRTSTVCPPVASRRPSSGVARGATSQCPLSWDTSNVLHHRSRKGFYAVNCQAGCHARLRFRLVSILTAGSTHDAVAWGRCHAAEKLEQGDLPSRFFFVGDDAYKGHDQLLTPWPGRNLDDVELDSFNNYQSRCADLSHIYYAYPLDFPQTT